MTELLIAATYLVVLLLGFALGRTLEKLAWHETADCEPHEIKSGRRRYQVFRVPDEPADFCPLCCRAVSEWERAGGGEP